MERLIPWLVMAWMISRPDRRNHASPMVLHHLPGRLRLRLAPRLDRAGLESRLAEHAAVLACRFNPAANTLLVRYDPAGISEQELLTLCQSFQVPSPAPAPPMARQAGELFGRALFDTFARQTIERSVFTMVTTVLKT